MRTKNSVFNIMANVSSILIQTVLVFLVRIVFTKTLDAEFLGIQGLFTNIISMLSLADLGIGTAICYSLYKPLADNDMVSVSKIVTLLKKVYHIISISIVVIGLVMLPFINNFVTGYSHGNLYLIFIIYILSLAFEYLLLYPEILITANQKKYEIAFLQILYLLFTSIGQIFILIYTHNFLLYILIDFIIKLIKCISSNIIVKKKYPNVSFNYHEKISKNNKKNITTNVKSLFIIKIGDYLVNGTDNLIISKVINISTTGLYGNYLSVVSVLKNIINTIMIAITSSFGNLIVKESKETQENVFNIMNFWSSIISIYFFLGIYFMIDPFIIICFGKNYLLSYKELLIISINMFLVTKLLPVDSVKSAAGIFKEDRYVPIIQAILNLMISIILAIKLGLIGVLLGTTISYLLTVSWEKPYIIYKKVFNKNVLKYYVNYLINIIYIIIFCIIFTYLFKHINLSNTIIDFIVKGLVLTVIYGLSVILIYHRKKEFKFIFSLIKRK